MPSSSVDCPTRNGSVLLSGCAWLPPLTKGNSVTPIPVAVCEPSHRLPLTSVDPWALALSVAAAVAIFRCRNVADPCRLRGGRRCASLRRGAWINPAKKASIISAAARFRAASCRLLDRPQQSSGPRGSASCSGADASPRRAASS